MDLDLNYKCITFVNMRESYAKETKKSKPVAIRYNLEEFEEARVKSGKKTVQSLFDFLLNQYVNGFILPVYRSIPMTGHALPYVQPEDPKISAYDAYKGDIERSGSIDQIKAIDREVQRDSELTSKQKESLKQIGVEKSKTLDF